jgi:glutamate formiminotransferase/formiminotetrahydrofolate cyclodeaminase
MVGKLSYGRKQWAAVDGQMREVLPTLHDTMLDTIEMIDKDTEAFNEYMAAMKMAKATEDQAAARDEAMQKE